MKTITSLMLILTMVLFIAPKSSAQDFVVEQRQVQVDHDVLYELLGDDLYGESETQVARRIFSMPMEEFIQREGRDVDVMTSIFYFKGNFVRMGDDAQYAIINLDTGTVQYVNAQERSYMEWTPEDSKDMEAQIEAQMQGAGYGSEDRDRLLQEMMDEAGIDQEDLEEWVDEIVDDDEEAGEVVGTGKTAEINGRKAVSHESRSYGVITVTWCSKEDAGLFETFKKMAESSAMLMMDEEEGRQDDDICLDGLPVREQTYHSMDYSYVIDEMLSVSEESLSDDIFRIPDGFEKTKFPF